MYDVTITNGSFQRMIHNHRSTSNAQKLPSGTIVDAENAISSFTFTIYPNNAGYDSLNAYTTLVKVRNTKRSRDDFVGRVLQITPDMDANGLITKTVVCEDRMGFLHDSVQPYSEVRHYAGDDNRNGLEEFIDVLLGNHNAQVEEYKRIYRGIVTVQPFESSDGVTKGLNWQTTFDAISEKLIGSFGGYIRLRETAGVLYLDYLADIGTTRSTVIKVGRNMRSASKEIDPSGIITRLIPLGAKLTTVDANGNEVESEERLTIAEVNQGINYVEASEYAQQFGIKYGTVIFDDVTDASNLLRKGIEWLAANNGLAVSHDIDALDLSLIGLDIDDFVVSDRYPVENPAIGIDDILKIIKKTTNIIEPHNSSFEMGDLVKRLSDTMIDTNTELQNVRNDIAITNSEIKNQTTTIYTYVNTTMANFAVDPDQIWAAVEDKTIAKSDYDSFSETVRNILQMDANGTTMLFQTITEAIEEVGDTEATHYAEFIKYIRFEDGNIILGEQGSAITLTLENDVLSFYNNGTQVAYLSDNTLFITDGRFLRSVRIGSYGFIPEANGSVSFTFLGGES